MKFYGVVIIPIRWRGVAETIRFHERRITQTDDSVQNYFILFQAFVIQAESSRCSLPFALRTKTIVPVSQYCPVLIDMIVQGPSLFHRGSVSSHFSKLTFSPTFHLVCWSDLLIINFWGLLRAVYALSFSVVDKSRLPTPTD